MKKLDGRNFSTEDKCQTSLKVMGKYNRVYFDWTEIWFMKVWFMLLHQDDATATAQICQQCRQPVSRMSTEKDSCYDELW